MKKFISLLITTLMSMLCFASPVYASSSDSIKPTNNIAIKQYYDNIIHSAEWKSEISRQLRGEMLQLPDEMLKSMTTDELIESVLEYPFFSDIYAFDNIQCGFDIMYSTFNGVRELSTRKDAASTLLNKYNNEKVITNEKSEDSDVFRITNMEILLSQNFVLSQFTENEKNYFVDIVSDKYEQKTISSAYGNFTCKIIFDLIEKNSTDTNLVAQIQAILNSSSLRGDPYVPGGAYTPNGTLVYSIYYGSEPCSQDELDFLNNEAATNYPYATKIRNATGKYNCHSYAWYNQDSYNSRWIPDPSVYWTDGSYTSSTNHYTNYKAVYWYNSTLTHSAIIYNGSSNILISKWGPGGLFIHTLANSPYYYCNYVNYYHYP